MREFTYRRRILLIAHRRIGGAFAEVGEARERLDAKRAERQPAIFAAAIRKTAVAQRRVARIAEPRGAEVVKPPGHKRGRIVVAARRRRRQFVVAAEAAVVLVVVLLGDDVP